jgi:ATP-dependent helicase/nuclease subunit A
MQVSVFGDPKQSIYSFRGADVEVFNRVANEYGQKPLDRNYRSTPALVSFFNCVTKGVFSEHAEGYLTPYQRLVADRAEFPSEICFDIATKDEDDREAEMIAQRIDSMTGALDVCTKDGATRKAGYGDMAILVDDTTRLSELTRALTRRGIPYQISSGSGFFEAPEVKTLVNLLSVLEDHEDDIALFGLLRSEMFHASDSEIYEISLREGKSLYSKLPPRIREDIEAWSSLVDILPLSELVSLIIREKSYRGILAMGQRRKTSVRNVNRFIGLLRSFESSGIRSIRTMSDMLVRFADMKAKEPESGVPEDNCVSIMTIHKAKGLEWPIVIVPYIYKRYRDNSDDLLMGEKEIGIKTNLEQYSIERRKSLTYIRLKKEEMKRYEEERKRVLYVAMTRARDHLFFTGCLNTEQPHRDRCWAREIFDMSLNLTQTAIWCETDNGARLHFAVEFDQKGGMWLKRKSVAQNRAARETEQVSEEVRFVDYAPPEQKIMIDPSYAGFLLECPMKYHLARDLGLSEDQLSGVVPAISREADGRFYGSVIHRALELSFAHPRLIVEQVALDESVDINEEIIREGVRRIERARSVLERSELKEMMPGAMEEVSFLKDMGDFCIKGRADLFLPEKRMVIDYKTDADLSERMKEYEVQLTLYAICLESTEACIYSVRDGALIPVRMDRNKLIADLRGRVRDLRDRKRIRGDHCEKCVYREICGSEGALKK